MLDVVIIGAGITGCATARALSRYDLNILVIEQDADVACGATKANSGILHAGYDCRPGTLKAALNVQGLAMYTALVKELDIPCRNNGSMVICNHENDLPMLRELYERGLANKVDKLQILDGDSARHIEPNLHPDIKGALLAGTACIISPYEAAIAFAENAAQNGVKFLVDTPVTGIKAVADHYLVAIHGGAYTTRAVVNAAGLHSADMHNYICPEKEHIIPQRGQYFLLDNTQRDLVKRTIFQLPTKLGKGVLVTPTVDYNILLGPTSDGSGDTATTREQLEEVLGTAGRSLKAVPARDKITAFAGIRAKHDSKDFIINEPRPGFVNALGIDSPGLTAAPAIAARLAGFITNRLQPGLKKNFQPERASIRRFHGLSPGEQDALIRQNPAYGKVVCRCETVTEAEITEAIRRPVGARNLDALKRRTRAQMGRCQGGFCTLRLIEILSRELGIPEAAITKSGAGSDMVSSDGRQIWT